jgi:hypothetical protein
MFNKLLLSTVLFIIGQTIIWFSSYGQFVWNWAKENPLLIAILTAIPAQLCFIYGVKHAFDFFQNGWGPRFYAFSLSFLVMPVLFWHFMGEQFFTVKNIASVALATAIIYIQVRLK